jgi:hypothetical protein
MLLAVLLAGTVVAVDDGLGGVLPEVVWVSLGVAVVVATVSGALLGRPAVATGRERLRVST